MIAECFRRSNSARAYSIAKKKTQQEARRDSELKTQAERRLRWFFPNWLRVPLTAGLIWSFGVGLWRQRTVCWRGKATLPRRHPGHWSVRHCDGSQPNLAGYRENHKVDSRRNKLGDKSRVEGVGWTGSTVITLLLITRLSNDPASYWWRLVRVTQPLVGDIRWLRMAGVGVWRIVLCLDGVWLWESSNSHPQVCQSTGVRSRIAGRDPATLFTRPRP